MKVKDLKNLISNFTSVKLVTNDQIDVFKGYFIDVPAEYADYNVDCIIPVRHPNNEMIGMAAILIYKE